MFGKKAKLAAQKEAQKAAEEKARAQAFTPVEEPVRNTAQNDMVFLESELIADDEIHGQVADAELLSTPANADKELYDVSDEDTDFDENVESIDEESDDELINDSMADDDFDEDEEPEEKEEEEKPEVMIVVDGPEEDDEIVKPAKLVKLPNLVDYMLTLNLSKKMKMNIAMLLLNAYQKFKDIPEEKAIVIVCMKKMLAALINS